MRHLWFMPHFYLLPESFVVEVVLVVVLVVLLLIVVTVVAYSVVVVALESLLICVPLTIKVKFLNTEVFAVDETSREVFVKLFSFDFFDPF